MGSNRPQIPPARPSPRLGAPTLLAALALVAGLALALHVPGSGAETIDELNAKIGGAREQAEALGTEIDAASAELAAAQAQAIAAARREAQLSAVLAEGEEGARRSPGRDLPRRDARRDDRAAGGGRIR
jgi:hypothetical protein